MVDRSDGVEIRKVQNTHSTHTIVLYYISSSQDHTVNISFMDQVPLTIPRDAIRFYPDYGSENWELYQDNQVLWSGEIAPDEIVVTAYSISQGKMSLPSYAPEILSVSDSTDEGSSDELLWRRSTVESLTKNVVEYETPLTQETTDDDLLDTVSSVLSHDVENLLLIINGRLELAHQTEDSEHLEEARTALKHLEDLISNLITLAEVGHQVTDLEPVDIETVATEAWYEEKHSSASLEIDSTGTVVADESSLRQLLNNLFRNAVDHGGDVVTVRIGALENYGFYVEDDGPGIPESQRDQVFEAGYSTGEQSGIGLSIVERLAEGHGWTIEVRESSDGGARFEFQP